MLVDLDLLQPSFKQSLSPDLVSSEDDLGPEIILNLNNFSDKTDMIILSKLQLLLNGYID